MAQDLNTNDLYKMITENKIAADQVAVQAQNTPTFQSTMQSGVVGQDKTLSSATQNYSDAVAQLFAHDKQMAASQITPTFAQNSPGYISDPSVARRYDADMFASRGQVVADSLKTMEDRKALLGDVVQKAVDAYKYAVQSKQISVDAGAKSIDQLSKLLSDAETKRSNMADEALAARKLAGETSAGLSESSAKDEFIKRYGLTAYNNLGAVSERAANAKVMMDLVNSGQDINPRDFMTGKDRTSFDAADALLLKVDEAVGEFAGKSGPMGTGPFAQFVPDVLAPTNTLKLRTAIATVGPEKIKEISGVAVSDKEFARLESLLPQNKLSEEENYRRLQDMSNRIRANQELKGKMILENMSASDAIKKYGAQIWSKYGLGGMPEGGSSDSGGDWVPTGRTK